jgi:hypothetical protein
LVTFRGRENVRGPILHRENTRRALEDRRLQPA